MAPIKVGFLGYGFSTRTFHLPFIYPNTEDYKVVAFLQRDGAKVHGQPGSYSDKDYPGTRRYKTLDGILGDKEVELVVIATGHDTHAAFAEKALFAGKHGERALTSWRAESLLTAPVVVEKLFTETSEMRIESLRPARRVESF